MDDLAALGAARAARAIRDGDVTAVSLAEALIARVERARALNAFEVLDADAVRVAAHAADRRRAEGAALGPLHGVPITMKANIGTAGVPTSAGTPALRDHRPAQDAPVAAALFAAGAIGFGRNTMHELAFGITSNNAATGAVRNPYDPRMIPGGSSGGTAAAVAARLAPAGIGTDTGGSVRVPAALCGVAGLRPTLGRWPQAGIVPIAATRDTAGPLARSVADLSLLDAVVTGDAPAPALPSLRGLRLGKPSGYFWDALDADTQRVCEGVIDRLRDAGAVIVPIEIGDLAALDEAVSFIVALYEAKRDLNAYLRDSGAGVSFADLVDGVASPDVRQIMRPMLTDDGSIPPAVYEAAIATHRPALIRHYASCFTAGGVEALIFPTTPLPARPIGEDETVDLGGARVPTFPTYIRNTDPGSNAGFPGVSLPAGRTPAGLPVGIALDGPPGSDGRLLAIAAALEAILPALAPPSV